MLLRGCDPEQIHPFHIVGHSVGGAVAVLFADRHPELTRSVTSVEGNFTLRDAFWSREVANKSVQEVDAILDGYKSDVAGWISGTGVEPTPWAREVAERWLNNQPASTVKAQARAVVEATGDPEYLEVVRRLLESDLPFHLIAGSRSRSGWDVPAWVVERATTNATIPDVGHLMMLEAPDRFATAILSAIEVDLVH